VVAAPPDAPAATRRPPRSRTLIALLVGLTALAPLSLQIFLPALPAIQGAFATTTGRTQLVLSLSILANAIATLIYGPLSDRFGRRPVILAGIGIFVAGSIWCTVAGSIVTLVIARILQSAGAAAGMVLARAIVRDLYDRDEAASVIAYLTMAMVVAPMLSPTIGALLIDHLGWRAIFAFTTLFGLALGWETLRHLIETRPGRPGQAAWTGMVLGAGQLMRSPAFVAYMIQSSFAISTFFAFLSGAPYYMISTLGRTATEYGIWFAVISAGFMAGNFVAARLSPRIGLDRIILLGTGLAVLATAAALGLLLAGPWTALALFGPMIVAAFGNGLGIANAQAGAVSVYPSLAGTASGLIGFFQLFAAAVVSQGVGMLQNGTPYPMAVFMVVCAVVSLAGFVLPLRRV
jgi:DHA1 family bicyclomycin/chloramphenicol resistance-like MFS transporter